MNEPRRHRSAIALLLFVLAISGATAAIAQTADNAPSAQCAPYASVPLPAEAAQVQVPKTSPSCASYRSYRGIGRSVDYAKARACAWQERLAQQADLGQNPKEPLADFVGGSLILADIYFNGTGVERNVPLSLRFACESSEGLVELALPDVQKLDGAPPKQPFEFCDYGYSTMEMNFCFAYSTQADDDRTRRHYNALKRGMAAEQQAAFIKLLIAEDAYVKAHAEEVYQGGTIRGLRTMGSENILKSLFSTELTHYESKKWPALSQEQIAGSDTLLRRQYQKTLSQVSAPKQNDLDDGDVTADALIKVQKSWEAYREAWTAFARLRYPAATDAIRAQITLERYRLLKTID